MTVAELATKAHLSAGLIYRAEMGDHIGKKAKRKIIYAFDLELRDALWLFCDEDPFA